LIVIVGHGPSIFGCGAVIDSGEVIRCKRALPSACSVNDFGTRTDYVVARTREYVPRGAVWWKYPDQGWEHWNAYFRGFSDARKYSHGLAAVFMAVDHLAPLALHLAGCDRLLGRPHTPKAWESRIQAHPEHDWEGEAKALQGLGIKILEVKCRSSSKAIP